MLRRLLLISPLLLASCRHPLSTQDVDVRGLLPGLAFTMTDAATGKTVTEADYAGFVTLLYFGYTNCPDVCPATLYNLERIEKQMGPDAARIKILFVTVDPDRDTPPILAQYAALFGANVAGLRGNADQLYRLAQRYRVVFSVSKSPSYTVTHSAAVYAFDGQGKPQFIISGLDQPRPDITGIARDLTDIAGGG